MSAPPTLRAYLDDAVCSGAARVLAVEGTAVALDRTWFYPGGGGQPADEGTLTVAGTAARVVGLREDEAGRVWHVLDGPLPALGPGAEAMLSVDPARRQAHARHHTLLHVLNAVALRSHGGWISGCQIAADYARIDFALEAFSPALCEELAARTNEVLAAARAVRATAVSEDEFRRRDDLRRTLDAAPPVIGGRVRVIEIEGFDAQACGGTHVGSTLAVGRCTVFRNENKGRRNKRLYLRLEAPPA
jgi:Ser-tRNA(Ala) deacylase AlaX